MPEVDTLTSVIEGAVAEATESGVLVDNSMPDVDTTETTEAPVETAVVETGKELVKEAVKPAAAKDTKEVKVEETPEVTAANDAAKEVAKLLEDAGIKEIAGKDNRIPYSRVTKIVGNALKNVRATHETTVKEKDDKLAAAELELTPYRNADRMILTDPDRYIQTLALIHPDKYKKFLTPGVAEVKPAVVDPVAAVGPEPEPDIKYNDGTTSYSPEQWAKHTQWVEDRATARAQAIVDKRMSPIEKAAKEREDAAAASKSYETRRANMRASIDAATKLWGKDFTEDYAKDTKSEILAYMKANPTTPFDRCVAAVLLPKQVKDRDKQREEILTELEGRTKGVSTTPVAAVRTAVKDTNEPQEIEDVIRQSLVEAGLLK